MVRASTFVLLTLLVSSSAQASSPVLLVPGFLGWREMETFGRYYGGAQHALVNAGADVYSLAPPPVASSEVRSRYLEAQIDEVLKRTGAKKVVIIAHSQGGLDVRWAIAHGAASKIAVVVTLSTPHEGTDLADAALAWFPQFAVDAALAGTQDAWANEEHMTFKAADAEGALLSLSRVGMREFNRAHPTTGGVPFFSVAAVSGGDVDGACTTGGKWGAPDKLDILNPLFGAGHAMIQGKGGLMTDDGVVPTSSMRFGTFLGCVPADHVDWMGWKQNRTNGDYVQFDQVAFLVELWKGMRDVEDWHDEGAMDWHVPALAKLAHAHVTTSATSAKR